MNRNEYTIISEVLRRFDAGETREEILSQFPEHRADIETIFHVIDRLRTVGESFYPEKKLLMRILEALPDVTGTAENRFSKQDDDGFKGRMLLIRHFPIHAFMTTQMKVLVLLLVLVILAGGVYFFVAPGFAPLALREGEKVSPSQKMPAGEDASVQEMIATDLSLAGNPDDVVNDIISSAIEEGSILDGANADGDFALYDATVVGELGLFSYE